MYKFRLFTNVLTPREGGLLTPREGGPRALPQGGTRALQARGNVSVSVRQRRYAVRQQVPFVVDTRQTYLRQFASGDGMVLRSEGPKCLIYTQA